MNDEQDERATTKTVVLYPRQIAIVETFAKDARRNFSNALQYIIEEWAKQNEDKERETA